MIALRPAVRRRLPLLQYAAHDQLDERLFALPEDLADDVLVVLSTGHREIASIAATKAVADVLQRNSGFRCLETFQLILGLPRRGTRVPLLFWLIRTAKWPGFLAKLRAW